MYVYQKNDESGTDVEHQVNVNALWEVLNLIYAVVSTHCVSIEKMIQINVVSCIGLWEKVALNFAKPNREKNVAIHWSAEASVPYEMQVNFFSIIDLFQLTWHIHSSNGFPTKLSEVSSKIRLRCVWPCNGKKTALVLTNCIRRWIELFTIKI